MRQHMLRRAACLRVCATPKLRKRNRSPSGGRS
jgi:hypothetical protein